MKNDLTCKKRAQVIDKFLFSGYGNVFPRTVLGKVATIVYAIFGMPLFLLYLSNIGDLLAKSFKWLYAKFCLCKICRLRRRRILNGDTPAPAVPSLNSWRAASEKTWPVSLAILFNNIR